MSKERSCAEYIRAIAGKVPRHTFVAKVRQVDGATCKVMRLDNNMMIEGVRLNELSDETTGIVIKPKADSCVLVAMIDDFNYYVSLYSEIDSIELQCDNIIVNGGNNGGLINIQNLTDRINLIEKDINNLKTIMSEWVPAAQDGGAALKSSVSGWAGSTLTLSKTSDYEDDKIKH